MIFPCKFTRQKVVLVTGGTGLVGRAVQRVIYNERSKDGADMITTNSSEISSVGSIAVYLPQSNETWHFSSSKDVDLRDQAHTDAYFSKVKPTHCLHLAATVGGLYRNMREPVKMLDENLSMNNNVLRSAHRHNVQKMTSCLSTCIFPDFIPSYPIVEEMLHSGPPHSSNEGYAYAKRILEVASRSYSNQFGRCYNCAVPTNVYGEYDNFRFDDAHVIPSLIHKCFIAKRQNTAFSVMGTGLPQRQFIYANDLARVLVWMVRDYHEAGSLIIAPDDTHIMNEAAPSKDCKGEYSIGDVARMIANAFQFNGEIRFIGGADGQLKKTVSNARLRAHIDPNFHFTPIETGIYRTVEWFSNTYPNCRC